MSITEKELFNLIKESIYRILNEEQGDEEDVRYDKFGNQIKRNGQGWGVDPELKNHPVYDKDGNQESSWASRSCAVATMVLLNDEENGRWFILGNQRGTGTPDYQGYWNLPCGYLDYNETVEDAAKREVFEETGIQLQNIKRMGVSSDPKENRQNVCFFFLSTLNGNPSDFPFSKDNMEENEVGGIQWIPVEKAKGFQWAFDHDNIIDSTLSKLSYHMNKGGDVSYNAYSCIDQAIDMLKQGSSPIEIIKVLENAKEQLS